MSRERIAVVLGTRPEIIKLADVIHELGDQAYIIHTGQHYDDRLSGAIFRQQGLRAPDVVLSGIGGQNRVTQIATGIAALGAQFEKNQPGAVIVQGDTNAVSAGAQAANYLGIPVIHVEAGLRSYDRAMPEEINRMVTGVLADVHCAATANNAVNLMREGVPAQKIAVTGNTIVEATRRSMSTASRTTAELLPTELVGRAYVLSTIHRPENTDTPEALRRTLLGLTEIGLPVAFLAHPRTVAAARCHGLSSLLDQLHVMDPVDHADFLRLASGAALLVSDSGGLQEEATVIGRPLLVVRRSTERPESMEQGFSRLITPDMDLAAIARATLADRQLLQRLKSGFSTYGDGKASKRIARIATGVVAGLEAPDAIAKASAEFPVTDLLVV